MGRLISSYCFTQQFMFFQIRYLQHDLMRKTCVHNYLLFIDDNKRMLHNCSEESRRLFTTKYLLSGQRAANALLSAVAIGKREINKLNAIVAIARRNLDCSVFRGG